MAGDALAMGVCYLLSLRLTQGAWRVPVSGEGAGGVGYAVLVVPVVACWLVVLAFARAYDRRILGVSTDEYRRVGTASVRFVALIAIVGFLFRLDLSRGFVAVSVLSGVLATFGVRHGLRVWLHRQRLKGRFTKGVVVVGTARAAADLIRHLERSPIAEMSVIGTCVPMASADEHEDLGVPVLGGPADVWRAAIEAGAETIVIADTVALSASAIKELAWDLKGHGIEVMVVPTITDVAGPRISFRMASGLPLIYLDEPHFGLVARTAKTVFDRVFAVIAGLLLLPVLAVVAVAVKVTSRGPVFFRQERVGLDGRHFSMWKFRSMEVDAEQRLEEVIHLNEHDGILFKIHDDPRVTPLGRHLRRWSLDELPQLWNILRGDMSVVGPRPPLPSEVERYDVRVRRRLGVKPGLTGLWQVSGRSSLSWEEGVRLDLTYVEGWSLTSDLVIIAKTAKAVALHRGAS